MEKSIDVSIILPSLNVAAYIRECMESVLNQTLETIEVICVDAGSTDGTLEILREYERMDKRVKIILSDKKSYGYQMNLGIKNAVGTYIGIVDTDDCVISNMYEILYQTADREQADFVKADYYGFQKKEDGDIEKTLYRILGNKEDYNCPVCIAEHQECFLPQITATWSGIYNREFLERNKIYYNETPGASFQDTGFWFLTYMFAAKAFFLEIPLYRYRLDNPQSSTYDSKKVYCICDEFEYIYKYLKTGSFMRKFRDTFVRIFYRKYKRNLERIGNDYCEEFLHRFSKDFQMLQKAGWVHDMIFSAEEAEDLNEIIENPSVYYHNILQKRKSFCQQLEQCEQIIIYGTGRVGQELFESMSCTDNVQYFAVSNTVENGLLCRGRRVERIDDLADYKENARVVIAVKIPEYQVQMRERAEKAGFQHIVSIPYGIFDF